MEKIINRGITYLWGIIVFFLTILSVVCSCRESRYEHIYHIKDDPLLHLVAFILVLVFGVTILHFKIKLPKFWGLGIIVIYAILVTGIIYYLQVSPIADQKKIVDIAKSMQMGDFSAFRSGGYLEKYTNQIGITYFFYLIHQLTPYGLQVVRGINIVSYFASVYLLGRISKKIFPELLSIYVDIYILMFLPLAFYIPFIYGNLMGFACSLLAVDFLVSYLENANWKKTIGVMVFGSLSVLIKQNYLITVIAIILVLAWHCICEKKLSSIGVAMLVLVSVMGLNTVVTARMEAISGQRLEGGIPATAWIAMGMQNGPSADGWYNGYNTDLYEECEYDREKADQVAKADIEERIKYFISHPSEAISFYLKKNSSQWNNPTFEGMLINYQINRERMNIAVKKVSGPIAKLTQESGKKGISIYFNLSQTIFLIGACAWIVLRKGKIQIKQLILPIIFIGGFLFHTIWEAKSQYVVTYFVLLLPYSLLGWNLLCKEIHSLIEKKALRDRETLRKNRAVLFVVVAIVFFLGSACIEDKLVHSPLCYGDSSYHDYLKEIE